jgi:hypothetical protein
MDGTKGSLERQQKAGGWSALYLALALVAAMPFFLLVVDYQGATTAADKVALIVSNYSSMYAMYLITYVVFGFALGVLALALYDRLRAEAPFAARLAAGAGTLWAVVLVACGLVFTYGMTTIVKLAETDASAAATVWRGIEPVALGLGGAGGEVLGGLWVLLVSVIALRTNALPRMLSGLGLAVGIAGMASVVPALNNAVMAFGILQIVWLAWLGVALLKTKAPAIAGGAAQ